MLIEKIEWDNNGLSRLMKSEEVNNALYKVGMDIADAAEGPAREHIKGNVRNRLFSCKTKRLSNTCIAIIHPTNRAAFNVEAKHGILKQIANRM